MWGEGWWRHPPEKTILRFSHQHIRNADIRVNILHMVSRSYLTGLCTVKIRHCENKARPGSASYACDVFWWHVSYGLQRQIWGSVRHCSKHRGLATVHVQSFPTSWYSAGQGINRGARCAPRMHVCRVPISEYTVIGLPGGLCLTFRLQVAGHSTAHPSSASAINPFLTHFSQT